jgi:glycosyltransferase involved in cell wall biosynthesis
MHTDTRVLIVSQYSLPSFKRNMNAYQRVYYGAEHARVTLLLRRKQAVSDEICQRATVHHAPVDNRWLFLIYAILFAGYLRARGCRIVLTEPSGFAAVGYLAKRLFGYFWALDLWDRPRWRAGAHEEGAKQSFADRFIFGIMRRADLFILSVLPPAVKDINPPPERCVRFTNAIDTSQIVSQPPHRSFDDPTLHLGIGKSIFDETIGLDVVIEAAELAREQNCQFHIHLVGVVTEKASHRIKSSVATDHFTLHGVVSEARAELFGRLHVGLVPYLAYEDLKYIFPIKVLEHLSQGNPVIATNIPGLAATIRHEYNGLLVEPGDPRSLADAIVRLQRDPALWERLARNALESIQKYDARDKNRMIFDALFRRALN